MMSSLNHENIVSFIGYCHHPKLIMAFESTSKGSLLEHLRNKEMHGITWAQRLKICIGAARGLQYLHSGLGEHKRVIHRDVKSKNILLDDNMEAKIGGFDFSIFVDQDQPHDYNSPTGALWSPFYMDPLYKQSGIVRTESDIYSFGIVLLEMLTGKLIENKMRFTVDDQPPQPLVDLIRLHYEDELDQFIDSDLKDRVNVNSLHTFKKIAYRCVSLSLNVRPTISRIIRGIEEALHFENQGPASTITNNSLESFLIPLTEIKLATGEFDPNTQIGYGGFGMVYKGELTERFQNRTVAIKRLDPKGHQGEKEFRSELELISTFHHPNIIPFVGYSDHYLEHIEKRLCLTWAHRLKICLGAARGLDYLHSGQGKDNRVIHRDVKSGNILLDENLEAQICDFGLSKQGPRNQPHTQVVTKAAGTNFYLDPVYRESGIVSRKSDVYSFGVVLFELMSGMLAYHRASFGDGKRQPLIELVRRYINDGPEILIDPLIKYQIGSRGFDTVIKLAYQCISLTLKERPTMDTIIDRIEDAIDLEEDWQSNLKVSQADTRFDIKKALRELEKEKVYKSSNYVDFYSYAFRYCLADARQKSINIESICELLEFVLGSRFPQQVDLFIKYLRTQTDYKVVSMDQWMGFYRFCNEISFPDFDNYNEELAWPLVLDNFVDWVRLILEINPPQIDTIINQNEYTIDIEGSPFL